MGAFQNGLRARHFNEILAQSPTASLVKVETRTKFYIKDEESNVEKNVRDVKKCTTRNSNSSQ